MFVSLSLSNFMFKFNMRRDAIILETAPQRGHFDLISN